MNDAWRIFGPDHIPYRILMLAKALDRVTMHQVRASANLSIAEWRVMAHLGRLGENSASGLAAAALVDRAEVSRAVRSLEERELIEARPNPSNRLSRLLALTGDGLQLFDRVYAERQRFFAEITTDLDPNERERMDESLRLMAQRLDTLIRQTAAEDPDG